jgi:hypothetical protein
MNGRFAPKAALGGLEIQLLLYPRKQTQPEIAACPKSANSRPNTFFLYLFRDSHLISRLHPSEHETKCLRPPGGMVT